MISHCFQGFSSTSLVQSPCGLTAVWISGRASDFDGDGCEALNMVSQCFTFAAHVFQSSIFVDIPLFHLFHTIRPTFCGNMADLGFCCLQDGVEDQDRDNDGVEDRMDRWTWPRVEWVAGRWNCLFQSAEIIEIITLASARRTDEHVRKSVQWQQSAELRAIVSRRVGTDLTVWQVSFLTKAVQLCAGGHGFGAVELVQKFQLGTTKHNLCVQSEPLCLAGLSYIQKLDLRIF